MKLAWKQILITFVISFVAGAGVMHCQLQHHFYSHWKHEDREKRMLERLSSKLHLTGEQKKQVEVILEEAQPEMAALRSEVRPKFEALRNSTNTKIRKILNSNQQEKFDQMQTEWEARKKKFFSN